ncbi:MAG: glutamine synthetase [Firmicutes bacterium]|nr:glutamine synthetase [Bacillota bacterium]
MNYTKEEVIQFIQEEDVKFIRLAFCDVYGTQKNISIMAGETERAFRYGIAIDAWSVPGFGGHVKSDLFLHPDPSTLTILPWRPEHGRVVRMFCDITYPDGTPFLCDSRHILKKAVLAAKEENCEFFFGPEMEFYLFNRDEQGNPTKEPYDQTGYMDIAPDDKGENVRREICLTLEKMGIIPESSHHEAGPGQNEIDFRYAAPVTAADNAVTFCAVVRTIANKNGLFADFSPKPLTGKPGNGMHINFSVKSACGNDALNNAIAGILKHIGEMTAFLNPVHESYSRLGKDQAPSYISWSEENRSQLIRIPAALGEFKRAELRSPDPSTNPYIAFALIIYAALDGIRNKLPLPQAIDANLFTASDSLLKQIEKLPATKEEASDLARKGSFIRSCLPQTMIDAYCRR